MRKKIISLLAVLFVTATAFATFVIIKSDGTLARISDEQLAIEQQGNSFTVNGVDVADVTNIYNKVWDFADDYERAFTQGYVTSRYYTYDRKKQVTSQEFKTMLVPLIEKYQPDSMNYFNRSVSNYDMPITRGIATCMAYYVARSIGAEAYNVTVDTGWPEDMWEADYKDYDLIIPHWSDISETEYPKEFYWRGEPFNNWQTCWMWNNSHVSLYSSIEVVAKDKEAVSYHWDNPFTWEDAVRAITRLYDSIEPEIVYVSMDDPRVTSPDSKIITPELIAKAAKKEVNDIAELPRQIGFFCGEGNGELARPDRFGMTTKEIKEYAEWGFNSLKYVPSWRHLFTNDMKVNLNVLKSLDEMVAASMEYGIHLYFGLCAVPGFGMYWAENYRDDYIMDTDILNPEKRKKACDIWRTLAQRYKDVPSVSLSFCPIQEITALYSPEGFGEGQSFTPDQIFEFVDILVDAIREVSPNRFIFYDAFGQDIDVENNELLPYTKQQYKHMSEKYKNTRIVNNLMDGAYMFYEYNTGDGNIDWAHHSVWVPTYPTTIYAGKSIIHDDHKLVIDGCLPKGTVINFYIADAADATMNIAADGNTLYEETINGDFNKGYAMAVGEPFRKSDKFVSITLDADAKEVTLSAISGAFDWCGIEVVLPESYAVDKWRKDSQWDVELGLIAEEDFHSYLYQKKTSTIQIGATNYDWFDTRGLHITINDNVTFTSDYAYAVSNKELTEQKVKAACEVFPSWSCRFEDILVTDMAGALNYWDDTMEIFQRYNIDVWISAIGLLSEENLAPFRIADYEGENFEGHHNFNVKLLRILQKYQDK